jgi:hypothetical protein
MSMPKEVSKETRTLMTALIQGSGLATEKDPLMVDLYPDQYLEFLEVLAGFDHDTEMTELEEGKMFFCFASASHRCIGFLQINIIEG